MKIAMGASSMLNFNQKRVGRVVCLNMVYILSIRFPGLPWYVIQPACLKPLRLSCHLLFVLALKSILC